MASERSRSRARQRTGDLEQQPRRCSGVTARSAERKLRCSASLDGVDEVADGGRGIRRHATRCRRGGLGQASASWGRSASLPEAVSAKIRVQPAAEAHRHSLPDVVRSEAYGSWSPVGLGSGPLNASSPASGQVDHAACPGWLDRTRQVPATKTRDASGRGVSGAAAAVNFVMSTSRGAPFRATIWSGRARAWSRVRTPVSRLRMPSPERADNPQGTIVPQPRPCVPCGRKPGSTNGPQFRHRVRLERRFDESQAGLWPRG